MDWDDVRYFLALARDGSARGAGATLGVSHTTVARRVDALEDRLAVRLFDRTPDGYVLTQAGQDTIGRAERVEGEMASLERALLGQDDKLEGLIRITCPDGQLSDLVITGLAEFCLQHPDIALEVTPSYRPFDLSKREADIAIRVMRVGKSPPDHLLGRKVATIYYANYVAKAHAARLDPEEVGNATGWLGWGPRDADELWVSNSSYPSVPVWGALLGTDLQLQAARAGLGIACVPCYAADRDPSLQRLKKDDRAAFFDVWMLSHPDLRDNARLRNARER
jgi:DNA-binding transcriptional LysR family regulator